MYIIMRNNRPFGNKKFETYEKARQHIRKWIRKNMNTQSYYDYIGGVWDTISRNPPSYAGLGFKVVNRAT
jgi:hypothetical protein